MAEQLGVTQSTYSRWEAGEVIPKLDSLKQAATVLDFPEQFLLNAEPFILTQHNNTNVTGYVATQHNHVPIEFVDKLLGQFETRFKHLESLCERLAGIVERHGGKAK